jgi:hypothetical protein
MVSLPLVDEAPQAPTPTQRTPALRRLHEEGFVSQYAMREENASGAVFEGEVLEKVATRLDGRGRLVR